MTPPNLPGSGGPDSSSGIPGTGIPDMQPFQRMGECSNCKQQFVESEIAGKTHCPNCGIAWINRGGKAGTVDTSAPHSTSTAVKAYGPGTIRLVLAVVVLLTSLFGGGAAFARSRR